MHTPATPDSAPASSSPEDLRNLARAFREARVYCSPKFSALEWCLTEVVLLATVSQGKLRAPLPAWNTLEDIAAPRWLRSTFHALLASGVLTYDTKDNTVAILSPKLWTGRVVRAGAPAAQLRFPAEAGSSLSYASAEVSRALHAAKCADAQCADAQVISAPRRTPPAIAIASEALAFNSRRIEAKAIAKLSESLPDRLQAAIGPRALHHPIYGKEWHHWLAKAPAALEFALAEFESAMQRDDADKRPTNPAGYVARIVRRYPT